MAEFTSSAPAPSAEPIVEPIVVQTPAATETAPVTTTEPVTTTDNPVVVETKTEPPVVDFATLTGGKYKDLSEVEALETARTTAEQRALDLEAKYNKPELQNWLEALTDEAKFAQLAPVIADLSINYKEMPPLDLIRRGWDEEYSQFVPPTRSKQEAYEEYLNSTFSVTDPNDRENGYGATSMGETNLLAKADSLRQKFESRQAENRTLAKEALQAREVPQNQAPQLTAEQIEAQRLANLAAFTSFKPALDGISEVASPFLDLAPQSEWLTSRAKELSENPFALLDKYFPVVNGVVIPNVSQILKDEWFLTHGPSKINEVAEKAIAHGRADGTTKIVERLQNPAPAPGMAQARPTTTWRSPTGAPPPGS